MLEKWTNSYSYLFLDHKVETAVMEVHNKALQEMQEAQNYFSISLLGMSEGIE